MRNAFIRGLIDIAKEDDKLVLLMAEVGFGVTEPFERLYPDRFYNVGISEQSLVLNAAGLAIKGLHPVAYSMSSFLPTRAFEMIKDSVCYQNLPVVLVGIGSGVSYGELGSTHHAIEEEAIMRSLPNLTVMFPCNSDDCISALRYAFSKNGPVYIGLEKINCPISGNVEKYSLSWKKFGIGKDGAIIAVGTMYKTALCVAEKLKEQNLDICVYCANTVKPMDCSAIEEAIDNGRVFVLDEHVSIGGVGESIARYILETGKASKIKSFINFSLKDEFPKLIYSMNDLLSNNGLVVEKIASDISKVVFGM